jgi:hypothetical protein
MANAAPATVTVTSTTGPGLTVTSQQFTDVNSVEINFLRNVLKITRSGANPIQYYDYSAMATGTLTISSGLSTLVFSV